MNDSSLLHAAESVVELAAYLDELKARAVAAQGIADILARGYLTPNEELALRQLQVSYWHSRNALMEIVIGIQREGDVPTDKRIPEFLVAFAAATLLVDVARFLRERYHQAAVIRRKLDEPDPVYGVPERMYETVQRSLTRPANAWALHRACQFYDARKTEIASVVSGSPWTDLLTVIDSHDHCLRPGWGAYFRTLMRVRGRKVARQVRLGVFGRVIYQLQLVVASAMADVSVRPGHQPGVVATVRDEIVAALQPGDVFVVRKEHAVTNYFLPGYWPHAALHLGTAQELAALAVDVHPEFRRRWHHFEAGGNVPSVLEAMKDGVRLRSVDSPLASDSVVVLRPRIERQQLAEALSRAMIHEGKPYDFDFDFTCSHRLVCTEVVYRAYDGVGPMQFELAWHVGRVALAAEELVAMAVRGDCFDPVLVYSPADSPTVLYHAEAAAVLAARGGPRHAE